MPTAPDASDRLLELERILASSSGVSPSALSGADLAETMLGSVLTDRIRRLTSLLSDSRAVDADLADIVAMRLLLADYNAAVSLLRAATRVTEGRLVRTAESIKKDGRRIERALGEAARRESARAQRAETAG
jgi:hypothetical protein